MKKNYITPKTTLAVANFEVMMKNASIWNGQTPSQGGPGLQHPVDYGRDIEVGTKNRFYNDGSDNDSWE